MAGMEIASLFAKVGADVGDFEKGMKKVKEDMSAAERGMSGLQSAVGTGLKVAAGVGIAAVGALATGIGYAVTKAADMEQGIANISAVMGLTSDETADLKGLIMDLGLDPKLKVSAVEAAQAIEVLGSAGITMDEILQGAARSTVLLANSTGADFAQAGGIASDVMAQFNIEAKDMAGAVDQITGVTVASKFTIDDYAGALGMAGGMASSIGVSFEDFNAVIAATAPSFSSGSDAGTSFKTFLTTLIPKSNEAEDAMKELGLVTTDYGRMSEYLSGVLGREVEPNVHAVLEAFKQTEAGTKAAANGNEALGKAFNALKHQYSENQFFDDTTGAMKDMDEIAAVLQTAFAGLTEEQMNNATQTIFGNDAMRTAFALAKGGAPLILDMKAIIGDTSAEESAATRMDTLSGAWEIFLGVVETLTLGIGDKFLPIARVLVEWLSSVAQVYGPPVIDWFGQLAANIEPVIGWLAEVVKTGNLFNAAFAAMPLPIQNVITGITNLVTTIGKFLKPIADAIDGVIEWQDVLMAIGIVVASIVIPAVAAFIVAAWPIVAVFAALVAASAVLRAAWTGDWSDINKFVTKTLPAFVKTMMEWGVAAWEWLVKATPIAIAKLKEWGAALWEWIGNNTPTWLKKLGEWGKAAWQWIVDVVPDVLTELGEWGSAIFQWIGDHLPDFIAMVLGWATALVTWIADVIPDAINNLTAFVKGIREEGEGNGLQGFLTMVGGWAKALWEWITKDLIPAVGPAWLQFMAAMGKYGLELLSALGGLAAELGLLLWEWIVDVTPLAVTKLGEWGGKLLAWITANMPAWIAKLAQWAKAAWEWIVDATGPALLKLGEWAAKLGAWVVANAPAWAAKLGQFAKAAWQWIVDMTPIALTKLGEFGVRLLNWVGEHLPEWARRFLAAGRDIVQGLWDGIKAKWTDLTNWFGGVWGGLVDKFKNFFGIHSPSSLFAELGENMMQGLQGGIDAASQLPLNAMDFLARNVGMKVTDMLNAVTNSAAHIGNIINSIPPLPTVPAAFVNPPLNQPPTIIPPTPPGGDVGPIQSAAVEFGLKNLGNGLNLIASFVDTADTIAEIKQFASNASAFLLAPGQPQLQGSSAAYMALQNLQGGGLESVSVNNLLSQIQTLIRTMSERGFGQQINIQQAPDATLQQQTELEALVAYLNALYA